jgi:hypothetical protein
MLDIPVAFQLPALILLAAIVGGFSYTIGRRHATSPDPTIHGLTFIEWFDERKMIAIFLLMGVYGLLQTLIAEGNHINSNLTNLISTGVGALSTGVGIMVQSIYREGQAEKANAETMSATMATLAGGEAAANGGPKPPQPATN